MTISHDVQDDYFTSILLGKLKTHIKPNDHVKLHSEKSVLSSYPCNPANKGLHYSVLGFHSKTILQAVSHLHSLLSLFCQEALHYLLLNIKKAA